VVVDQCDSIRVPVIKQTASRQLNNIEMAKHSAKTVKCLAMSDEPFPIIDVSSLKDDFGPKAEEIVAACRNWGFLILTGYGIPQKVIDRMYELVRSGIASLLDSAERMLTCCKSRMRISANFPKKRSWNSS
jgi:hypothetical protein